MSWLQVTLNVLEMYFIACVHFYVDRHNDMRSDIQLLFFILATAKIHDENFATAVYLTLSMRRDDFRRQNLASLRQILTSKVDGRTERVKYL